MSGWLKAARALSCLLGLLLGSWWLTALSLQSADNGVQLPTDEQVVGGRNATPGEFPWQAYLEIAQTYICGGSLLNDQWVVTAAHCVTLNGATETDITIVLGEHQLSVPDSNEVVRQASQVIPHPQYNEQTADNDIALVKLNSPVTFNGRITAIPLITSPADDTLVAVGKLATVSGWGALAENGDGADILQTVSVPIISNSACNAAYNGEITDNMLCAGYVQGGKDACQGDSGGPLIVPNGNSWQQAGVVSFGNGCARPGEYGVYTRISRYISWINSVTGNGSATATPIATSSSTATPSATATTTAAVTPSPTATPLATATPSATPPFSGNYLRNGNFEAGPNGDWAESSNHFGGLGGLISKQPSVSPLIAPIGFYAARLGGVDAEQANLSQNVTLPPGKAALLRFSYRLVSDENQCGDDRVLLQVNNNTVAVFNLCQSNQNQDWQEALQDLSAYLGKSFKLQFLISTDDQLISRFVIDNLALQVNGSSVTPTPTPESTVIANSNFEAGANSLWYEKAGAVATPGAVIVNAAQAPVESGALTGNYLAWLGGDSLKASAILSQTFVLPNDPPVSILYNYQARSRDVCNPGTLSQQAPDTVAVDVYTTGSTTVHAQHALCQQQQTTSWQQWQQLDVSAFAGQRVTLRFDLAQDPFAPSSLLVDNFTVASATAPQLRLSKTHFDFYATTSSSVPAHQQLVVVSGVGNSWSPTAATANWLTLSAVTTGANQLLDLAANPALTGQGVHTATFQIQAGAQRIPIQVRLLVGAPGLAQANPTTLRLQAQPAADGIWLAWQPSDKNSVLSYRIQRQQNNDPQLIVSQNLTDLAYRDQIGAGLQSGQRYCYQIEALNKQGAVVVTSNRACATAGELLVWAPYVVAKLGATVDVPIYLENSDGLQLEYGRFNITYNPEVLRYQDYTVDLTTSGYSLQITPDSNSNLIGEIAAADAANPPLLSGPQPVVTLRFTALTDSYPKSDIGLQPDPVALPATALWLAHNSSNSSYNIPVHFQDGVVQVQAAPHYQPGDIDGDGQVAASDTTALLALLVKGENPAVSLPSLAPEAASSLTGAEQQSALIAGDVNGNQQLDTGDAVRLAYYVRNAIWPSGVRHAAAAPQAAPVAMTLTLTTTLFEAAGLAQVYLRGSELAEFGGGEAVLVYDPQVIEQVSTVESLLPGATIRFADNQRGQLALTWLNDLPTQGEHDLVKIVFKLRTTTNPPSSRLLLAAAQLYDRQGHDLSRSANNLKLIRQHAWIGALPAEIPLYLPLIRR